MTDDKQLELQETRALLVKQFMSRKQYSPVDIVINALGSGDMFYKRVIRRIYKEAKDLSVNHTLTNMLFSNVEKPEYKQEDVLDLYVTDLYVDQEGHTYFGMSSSEPKLVNMLPMLKFSLDTLPFLAKLNLGIKLDK